MQTQKFKTFMFYFLIVQFSGRNAVIGIFLLSLVYGNILKSENSFSLFFDKKNQSDTTELPYLMPWGGSEPEKPEKYEPFVCYFELSSPEFTGGQTALLKFIHNNIQFPKGALESCIEGRVYIGFIINLDGKLSDIRIIRGLGGGCDEEAVRIVKLMPNWKPKFQEGKPVKVSFIMPIRFHLE